MNNRRRTAAVGVAVAAFFAVFYLFTGNRNFIFDALANAIACEAGEPHRWFHSNHILYPFLGMIWYRIEGLFGYAGYAVYSLERFNSLLTACGLGLLYGAAARFNPPQKIWVLPFFLGSTYAVWHFAVDGYTVGASSFFSCLLLYSMSKTAGKEPSRRDVARLVLQSGLYVGVHAMGFLHALAVAWWLGAAGKTEGRFPFRPARNRGVQYLGGLTVLVLSSYLALYLALNDNGSVAGFIAFGVGYASFNGLENMLSWPALSFGPAAVMKGQWEGWTQALVFPFRHNAWERLLTAGVGLGSLALLSWALLKRNGLPEPKRSFVTALFGWGLLNAFIIGFWVPGYPGFRVHYFFPLFLAAAVALGDRPLLYRFFGLAGGLVFLANFTGPIHHDSFIANNKGYQLLREIDEHLDEGDSFICVREDVPDIAGLRTYFFPHILGGPVEGRLFESREKSIIPLREGLARSLSKGRRVYMTESLQKEEVQRRVEREFGMGENEMKELLAPFVLAPRFRLSSGLPVYEVISKTDLPKSERPPVSPPG